MSLRFSETELVNAHSHSSHNLEEVQKSANCECFHCLKIFSPSEVTELLADGTVLCPDCGIDSVLGSMSGYPLTRDFLVEMNGRWFRKSARYSRRKNARNVAIVIVTSIMMTSSLLLPSNSWVLFLGAAGFVVFVITISYSIMIRRRFRRASKDQNAEGTP